MKPKKCLIFLSLTFLLSPSITDAKFTKPQEKDIEDARKWIEAERVIFSGSKKNTKKPLSNVSIFALILKNLKHANASVIVNVVKWHQKINVMDYKDFDFSGV